MINNVTAPIASEMVFPIFFTLFLETGFLFYSREWTSARERCLACMAPRRILTCQPRHTNEGEGAYLEGGALSTATKQPD
jgi:hypothetical protein